MGIIGVEAGTTLYSVIVAAVAIILCLLALKIIKVVTSRAVRLRHEQGKPPGVLPFLRYVLNVLAVFAVISGVVSDSTSDMLSKLLTGSGIVAVVISISCQEAFGNLASGVVISMSRPFEVGDVIRYLDADISGTVEEITLRHTVIRTFENKRLIVPNGTLNRTAIENSTDTDRRICLLLNFSVSYESDIQAAMDIIADVVLLHPRFCDVRTKDEIINGKPPVRVQVIGFEKHAITIRAWVWAEYSEFVGMRSDILVEVARRFKRGGVAFAYPRVTLEEREV